MITSRKTADSPSQSVPSVGVTLTTCDGNVLATSAIVAKNSAWFAKALAIYTTLLLRVLSVECLPLLPLRQRIAGLAVEIAESHGHADLEAEAHDARHQQSDLRAGRYACRFEAAAEIVGAECFWRSVRPHFDAA